jgi:hypothetical protein
MRWRSGLACALPLLALFASPVHAQPRQAPRADERAAGKDVPRAAVAKSAPGKKKKKASRKNAKEVEPDVDKPADEGRPISIGVVGGYGVIIDDAATEGINPFGVGFGISGGYALGRLYVGTRFLFFLGEKRTGPDDTERSADEFLVGFEVGFTVVRLGPLALRPELGLGLAFSSSEAASSEPVPVPLDTSSTDPYVDVGVVLELSVSRELFFSVHARAVYVPFKESARGDHELIGVPLLGACGMRF